MSTIVTYDLNKKSNNLVFGTVIVNRIDNPFDPINSKVTKTDIHGGKLSSYLEGYCLGADIKVALNGKVFTDDYDTYIVQPNDIITYTNIIAGGGGGGKQVFALVAMIALAIVTAGMAVPAMYGAMGYASAAVAFEAGAYGTIALVTLGTMGIMMAGSLLINAFISPHSSNSALTNNTPSAESSTYSWNGITTSRELNKPIPVLYGTHALGGTVINSRFYYKDSDDWLATQLALCQGEVEFISTDNIRVQDSTLSSFVSQSAVFLQQRSGTQNQSVMTGYGDSIYNNATSAKELKYNIPYEFTTISTNIDFFRLHFMFPEGLYKIDTSTGNKTDNTVEFTAQYRQTGTSTWYDIYDYDARGVKEYKYTYQILGESQGEDGNGGYTTYNEWFNAELWSTSNDLTSVPGNTRNFALTGEFRYNASLAFEPSTTLSFTAKSSVPIKKYFEPVDKQGRPITLPIGQYDIKITRLTVDDTVDKYDKSTSTFRFIEEINTLDINYGGIALLGIDLKATDTLNSSRPNFSVVARRKALFLDGKYYQSDNPAYICLDILTNKSYGMGIDITEIDLPAFKNWGAFCNAGIEQAFTLTKTINTPVNGVHIFGDAIAIPASDIPVNEHITNLSQLDLNLSSLSARGKISNFTQITREMGINDIKRISYEYVNGGYYYLLHMGSTLKQGMQISYNLVFNNLTFINHPKLKFNGVFDTSSDIWTSLQDVAQIGRGQVILRGNKYSCIYDAPKTVKGLFNAANSSNVTVQYLNGADIATEIEIQFADKSINYEMNSISVQDSAAMASGVRSNKTTRQVRGITSEADALIYGKYMLATSKFIRRIITLDADIESITQTIGDLIAVQTDVTQYGIGGLVENVLGTNVILDNLVTLEYGKEYSFKIKRALTDEIIDFTFIPSASAQANYTFDDSAGISLGVLTFNDFSFVVNEEHQNFVTTNTLVLPNYNISKNDRYTFGIKGSDSILCTITNIDRDGDLNRKITAVEYNESILDFNYDNDMLQRINPTLKPKNAISNFSASDRLVKLAAGQVVAMISFGWESKISSSYNIYLLEANGFKHYLGNDIKTNRFEYPNTVLVPENSYTIYIEDIYDPSVIQTISYTVTSFSTPPEDITSVSLSTFNANIEFNINYINKPLDFAYYNIYKNNILISTELSDTFDIRHTIGTNTVTYSIEAVDMIKKKSRMLHKTFTPVIPIINSVDYFTDGENIKFTINSTKGSFDIDYYQITYDNIAITTKDDIVSIKADFTGIKTFTISAFDALGNKSNGYTKDATINVPPPLNINGFIDGKDVVISWGIPASNINIDYYEITYDSSVIKTKTNSYRIPVFWGGNKIFSVKTVNILGAQSTNVTTSVIISAGIVTQLQTEVIDNNVLLRWSAVQGSLPIENFLLYKGIDENHLTLIGEKKGTFTTIFENNSGTYTYWLKAIDSAGNASILTSATTQVSEPPDYILNVDWKSAFNGTLNNAKIDNGTIVIPINSTESIQQHFVNNSWSTPQNQIDSGNNLWIQPFKNSGYYEEVFDYGVTLASSLVTLNIDSDPILGSPTISTTISISSNGTTWIDYAGQLQVYGTGFRYVKIRITVSGINYGLSIKTINVKLDSKIKSDSGTGVASSSDLGGTIVYFNKAFVDITSISVTPSGTTPAIAIYDFQDTPNPTQFKVLLYNTSGVRINGNFSWSARGY